jgi:hypothetical protein
VGSDARRPAIVPSVDQRNFHAPQFCRHACGHRGSYLERFMDAAKIVEHEIQRQRVAVIFQLL